MIFRQALTFLALLFLALTACAEDGGKDLSGIVTWVYDGDTLEIKGLGKVRLIGIDTPERENSNRDWYLKKQGVSTERIRTVYQAAREYNIQHVKGQRVVLELDNPMRDKYGRLLAYIRLPDGTILNRTLLEKGLAVVYRKFSFQKKDDFIAAEKEARKRKVGLWE